MVRDENIQWCPIIRPHRIDPQCCEDHCNKRYFGCAESKCEKYMAEVGRRQTKARKHLTYQGKGGVDD